MKLRVRVHTGASAQKTEQRGEELHVWVRTPPVDGRANLSVAAVLAKLHRVPKSSVRLAAGHTSRTKIFEIEGI